MRETWQSLRWAGWLGWKIESNWTEPLLFAIYAVVKPVAGSLLLVCMYYAARLATSGAVPTEFLPYMYVGNACYFLVGAVTFGMSYTVISDREHYRMLKFIFISPVRFRAFFVGRGLARAAQSILGALVNLIVGILVFSEIREALFRQPVAWGWLLIYLAIGIVMLGALGMILISILLNMARHGMFLSEGLAGVMYFLCGVIFPISILPGGLQIVGLCLPPTYWLEGMRRALLGEPTITTPLSSLGHVEILGALLASTTVLLLVAEWTYAWGVRRAKRLGRLEHVTGV